MFYSVLQGSRYILYLTNQRSWFEVRRLQYHQQIKAHGQHMVNKTWLEREKSSDVIWSSLKSSWDHFGSLMIILVPMHDHEVCPILVSPCNPRSNWIPVAISKIQTGMIMSSLSGVFILAGTICKQTLHETCYLI